jgi:predicted dehydrogenase
MIRCGIIGFGKMGRIRAQALAATEQGKVVLVYEPDGNAEVPFPRAQSEDEVLASPDVEAVFVCTPNYRIVPLCVGALQAGKHVFSEKPPVFNAAELEQVLAAEKASGKKLMYGFNHRHHGSILRMQEIVQSGDMGRILWMRGRYGKEVDATYFRGWRAKPELAGGGILLDQGIHMLDLFLHFGGEFDEIHSLVSNLYWQMDGLEDNVFAIMRNQSTGVCASLHSTMTQWRYLFSLEIFLERGALVLNGLKTSSGAYGDEDLAIKWNEDQTHRGVFQREERVLFHTDMSWEREVRHFFDCIARDEPVSLGNSSDAAKLMRAIDRIYNR